MLQSMPSRVAASPSFQSASLTSAKLFSSAAWAGAGSQARGFLGSTYGYPFEQSMPSTLAGVKALNDKTPETLPHSP